MGAVYFYHLTRAPLESVLPMLAEKSLCAGWRVVVRGTDKQRLEWLDQKLWLGADDSFLPHGLAGGAYDAMQPVLLTTDTRTANNPTCILAIDGSDITAAEVGEMQRVSILFDGNDETALNRARQQWKELTNAGCSAQYWSQESGNWQMKAER
ncbi:MAG TPA: DNA polymerase III subunit chi [Rhodobacteraceae bacterium]|jgi:DNA polymerase-3 subunit chi|nr:DNA polymerase III subunit chi [Paracoccaceae bacterium]